jgi:hypothetical protein
MDMIATTFDIAMFLSRGGGCVQGIARCPPGSSAQRKGVERPALAVLVGRSAVMPARSNGLLDRIPHLSPSANREERSAKRSSIFRRHHV